MAHTEMVARGPVTDWISLGVVASAVPGDAAGEAIEATGRAAKRAGGKLPPHVMVYFAMALALFADDDYEEVAARLAGTLAGWDCWDEAWEVPASGGLTQARQRLGHEPLAGLFSQVAVPVAEELTRGAFPKARVVTISECASHAVADARIGGVAGKGAGEQSLARPMLRGPKTY